MLWGNEITFKILERLVKIREIKRIRRGIYVRPQISPYVGPVTPSIESIVKTIVSSADEVLQIHGAEAARQLGLSTQVPVKPTFLTNGRSRKLSVGKIEIEFKRASSKKLVLAGTQAGLAISALWYLVKENISAKEFEKFLKKKLNMPFWMSTVVASYKQKERQKYWIKKFLISP